MTWEKEYKVYETSLYRSIPLAKFFIERKKGVSKWFNYLKCRFWYGEHNFESEPTYYRPQFCKRCGSRWFYNKLRFPPPYNNNIRIECPRCLHFMDIDIEKRVGACLQCFLAVRVTTNGCLKFLYGFKEEIT